MAGHLKQLANAKVLLRLKHAFGNLLYVRGVEKWIGDVNRSVLLHCFDLLFSIEVSFK